MNVCCLISGGKDSIYSLMKCKEYGNIIVCLVNLRPINENDNEKDSYMYQSVGFQMIPAIAEALQIPLEIGFIKGSSKSIDLEYKKTFDDDEVEDLYEILYQVKQKYPIINAVSCGAILSNYQRNRVENVCSRLNLQSLSYLWQKNQEILVREMIENQVEAILIKVASMGLKKQHLGKTIKELSTQLFPKLSNDFGFHFAGEGGEYETLTLDCPLYCKKIVIDETEIILHDEAAFSQVAYLIIKKWHFEEKLNEIHSSSSADYNEEIIANFQFVNDLLFLKKHEEEIKQTGIMNIGPFSHFITTSNGEDDEKICIDSVMNQLEKSLISYKLDLHSVIFVNLAITDMSRFAKVNEYYCTYFLDKNAPSRATIEIKLSTNNHDDNIILFGVCLDCLIINNNCQKRTILHVKSISEWAPVCIGPYSQCNVINDLAFVSGQIALDPISMSLVTSSSKIKHDYDTTIEMMLVLRHCEKILKDSVINSKLSCIMIGILYINKKSLNSLSSTVLLEMKIKQLWDEFLELKSLRANNGLFSCIVIDDLPRGAAVELQVVALRSPSPSLDSSLFTSPSVVLNRFIEQEEDNVDNNGNGKITSIIEEIKWNFNENIYTSGIIYFDIEKDDEIHEIAENGDKEFITVRLYFLKHCEKIVMQRIISLVSFPIDVAYPVNYLKPPDEMMHCSCMILYTSINKEKINDDDSDINNS